MLLRLIRGVSIATAVAAGAAVAMVASPPVHASAQSFTRHAHARTRSFTMYNATDEYGSSADLEQYGVTDSAVVYEDWPISCSTTSCSDVPTQSEVESKVQAYVGLDKSGSTGPVTLDFESILPVSASSDAQAAQEVSLWKELITWAHDAEPHAPIGIYSYDWSNAYESYTAQLYKPGYLDYFAPSMYNRWDTVTDWKAELRDAISNDHAINSRLPIYPYLWALWDTSSDKNYLSGSQWATEFADLEASVPGAILWGAGPLDDTSACGWLGAFSNEMGSLTGTGSTGPLSLTASPPDSCVFTSGTTTSVPFTVTNHRHATTAATTMADNTGPQGITLGDFEYWDVPALAHGRSWSSAANVTIPSGTTIITALLKFDYGTGFQRMAIIIVP
jgi:hypothetical protein